MRLIKNLESVLELIDNKYDHIKFDLWVIIDRLERKYNSYSVLEEDIYNCADEFIQTLRNSRLNKEVEECKEELISDIKRDEFYEVRDLQDQYIY